MNPAGIVAIEVWDLAVGGRLLQEWRDDAAFVERVADAVVAVTRAPPVAWSPEARALAPAIARVHLVGGAADDAACAAIAARGLPCTRSRDPFAAARAAAVEGVLGVDVGQTGIKLALGDRVWRVARDHARAPLRDGVADREAARASTIAFLAETIAGHAPRAVVGLPCELPADGIPRSCSYAWRDPDPTLVAELAAAAGTELTVLNDAVLAAIAARAELTGPALVLTLGFGVGGALVA